MRTRLLLPFLLLSGCALDSGEGFAVLEPTVTASYVPVASRNAGNGFQRLASDYQVSLGSAALGISHVELVGGAGGGGPTTFDPANPPPGYSLCHNGHCHSDGGALVDYEDIEAELGGGGSSSTLVAALHVDGEFNLLTPETTPVECEPDCELSRTAISRGVWEVTSVTLTGVVRDSRATPRLAETPFRMTVVSEGGAEGEEATPLFTLAGEVDVPSDREHKPRVKLALTLEVPPTVFDGLDWAALTPGADGVLDLGTVSNEAARKALFEELAALKPQAEVRREDR
ncbi:hypothetical protein [Myxococcus eversor]|uniref:hypothetical protein n=1 Tax=Myxococcus eversor TaxID=2709661 RepID=UPI0013D22382|nr:hypothetical protein [Myxococcus eversor]